MSVIDLLNPDPPLNYRFGVFFFAGGVIPNPLDFRFQKVSGMTAEIVLETLKEGEGTVQPRRLPKRVDYKNLTLDRGYALGSPLGLQFNETLASFRFHPSNVMVTLLSEVGLPLFAWHYLNANIVRWEISDLDARNNEVVIETMELTYNHFQMIRI